MSNRRLQHANDDLIFDHALADDRIVVSADTDFGTLLAARSTQKPSVIQFRGPGSRRPESAREVTGCQPPSVCWSTAKRQHRDARARPRPNSRAADQHGVGRVPGPGGGILARPRGRWPSARSGNERTAGSAGHAHRESVAAPNECGRLRCRATAGQAVQAV